MTLFLLLLGALLSAIFMVGIGQAFRPVPGEPDSHPDWVGFLAVSWGLLMAVTLTAYRLAGEAASWILLLLLPSMCALLAELVLFAAGGLRTIFHRQALRQLCGPGAILLVDLILLAALAWLGDVFIPQAILFVGFVLAFMWLVWDKLSRRMVILSVVHMLLLLYAWWSTDSQAWLFESRDWLASIEKSLAILVSGLGMIALARLLGWVFADTERPSRRRLLLALALALPILLFAGAQAATSSAWDVATDGLGGVWALGVNTVYAIVAAILLAWRLPVQRRAPAFMFVVLVALFISAANWFGTFGLDGAWGNLPRARTERRAAMINQAIVRYHERQGGYPRALSELTPRYLLYLPTPFIIPGQEWCYQGGTGSYRLGYVYREYFSTPASVKIHASAGDPPDDEWTCEEEAARYMAP